MREYKTTEKRREYAKAYYQENRDTIIARVLEGKRESRRIIADAKAQPCQRCGESFPEYVMEFHHRDPSTKVGEPCNLGHPTTVKKEIAKCDTLCANCHRIVEYESAQSFYR